MTSKNQTDFDKELTIVTSHVIFSYANVMLSFGTLENTLFSLSITKAACIYVRTQVILHIIVRTNTYCTYVHSCINDATAKWMGYPVIACNTLMV